MNGLYLPRQNGGRGLISCEMCVKAEENNLGCYIRNSNERLMEGARKAKILNSEGAQEKDKFKQDRQNVTLNGWSEKKMHGQFLQEMPDTVDKVKTWEWTKKGDLKVETEALICAVQEQTMRTKYVKFNFDKSVESPLCRLCGQKGETNHIISECKYLAQKEYKRRHDNIARLVHWTLCCKHDLSRSDKWYDHQPDCVLENERKCKILWDMTIQCDHVIEA